jgi:hypothetical protein
MWCLKGLLAASFLLATLTLPAFAQNNGNVLSQNPLGVNPPAVTAPNPSFVPPTMPYVPFGALPAFVPADSYVATDQFGNPYFAVNPYIPNNPIVPTPIVPNTPVPTPVVPNLNVIPNGPMSPGFVMPGSVISRPVVIGPYGFSLWAPTR